MLTAATTVASPARTGALTDATPASRSSTLSTHPRGPSSPDSTRPAEPSVERQPRALGHDPAQGVRRRERQHASPLRAFADEELHALAGLVAESRQHGTGQLDEREALGRRAGRAPPAPGRGRTGPRRRAAAARAPRARPPGGERSPAAVRSPAAGRRAWPAARQRRAECRPPCRARRHPLQCPYRKNSISDHETWRSRVADGSYCRGHRR